MVTSNVYRMLMLVIMLDKIVSMSGPNVNLSSAVGVNIVVNLTNVVEMMSVSITSRFSGCYCAWTSFVFGTMVDSAA